MRARLAAGVHTIKFRARSPQNASVTDVCQTVISVNSAQPTPTINYPEVVYCPPSIDIQLEPNENQRPVFWKDPKFNSDKHLKQILASQLPGTKFSAGRHNIVYTATDLFNRNATCRFVISLTASPGWYLLVPSLCASFEHRFDCFFFFSVVQRNAYTAANYHQPLSNHVSSLICPDKPAMKLDTSFPVSSVRVFYRQLDKNHRFGKSAQTQIHTTRRIDNQPKHFIDIYHWSVFDTA